MKIATFNINNVNKRLANLLDWLSEAEPDVVCLQELKATDREFPRAAIERAGYGAVWRGQSTWNGVAILARGADPVLIRAELARRRRGQPGPLHRGGGRRRARSPRSMRRTATRSPARNSTTSLPGTSG